MMIRRAHRKAQVCVLAVSAVALAVAGAQAQSRPAKPVAGAACTATFTNDNSGTFPRSFKLDQGKGLLSVDLSGLPAGAEVFRAELVLKPSARMIDRPTAPTLVYADDQADKPLAFVAPRFVSLDALQAVQAAVKAGGPLKLVLKQTCNGVARLEVSYIGGRPGAANVPTVAGLRVIHRAGQSLIVFEEPKLEPLLTLKTHGQARKFKAEFLTRHPDVAFRIWRGPEKITAQTIAKASLVGECGFFTGYNELFYFGRQLYGKDPEALRYSVTDGGKPVPWGTAVYAHNPPRAGKAYYAVTVAVNGEEDLWRFDAGNTTAEATDETVGLGVPVLQRTLDANKAEGWSKKLYYTRWESWPHSSTPSLPIDYAVQFPDKTVEPAPVGLHLHAWEGSLDAGYGWWFNRERGTVLIASNQIYYDWWTGYHEAERTCKTLGDGRVHPFTMTRLLGFLDWAATQWKLDTKRVFTAGHSMGGSGAPTFAIRFPDRIAWCAGSVGIHIPEEGGGFAGSYRASYGPRSAAVTMPDGKTSPWDYFSDEWYLRQNPEAETGFIIASNGKNDGAIPWPQAHKFARALQETRRPHMYNWGLGGHLTWTAASYGRFDQDVRTDQTLPAFTNGTLDNDIGTGKLRLPAEEATREWLKQEAEIKAGKRKRNDFFNTDGEPTGGYNLYLRWQTDDVVDTEEAWEMTVILLDAAPRPECRADLTPRRLQRFRTPGGSKFTYKVVDAQTGKQSATGQAVADGYDLLTLKQIPLIKGRNRITISPTE